MDQSMDFGKLIDRIWTLTNKSEFTSENIEELDFYNTVFSIVKRLLTSNISCNQFPISFNICSMEKAQIYAQKLGITISEYDSEMCIFFCK